MKILHFCIILIVISACKEQTPCSDVDLEHPYLLDHQIQYQLDTATMPWKDQVAANNYADNGNYLKSLEAWDAGVGQKGELRDYTQDSIDFYNKYTPVNAIDYILESAKDHRIVIINEAHHNPRNRVFTRKLLRGLKEMGFDHMGFEALGHEDTELNDRGFPVMSTGYYTKEPQFANLVREALQLGFKTFPYETNERFADVHREVGQASYIKEYLDANPGGKYVIHCGYAHAYKGEYSAWGRAMAQVLFDTTGIEPFTIDQQQFREKSDRYYEARDMRWLDLDEPTVFVDSSGASRPHPQGHDYTDAVVFFDRTEYVDGRPDWIFTDDFRPARIPLGSCRPETPFLVAAYPATEQVKEGVPMDLYQPADSASHALLALKPGVYNIVLISGDENVVFEYIQDIR